MRKQHLYLSRAHTIFKRIVFAILAATFIAAIVLPLLNGTTSALSFGVNGVVETRCIGGFEYKVTTVSATQVVDAQGRAKECRK